jgi:hypothetical protein
MAYQVELTDTFGGEANYSWVRRERIAHREWTHFKDFDGNGRRQPKGYQAELMRRAKAAVGMTGVRGVTYSMGDGYEFRPYGMCQVMFVTWIDE